MPASNEHTPPSIQDYIAAQRDKGISDEHILHQLVQAGWDANEVSQLLAAGVPAPDVPLPPHQYSQTGNTGTPLQVENVQYGMRMRPVESKVGLYLRLTMLGLWVTVFAVCVLLANIIDKVMKDSTADLGSALVVVLSLCAVSVPLFVVANKKRATAIQNDPRLLDDLFFKKQVRKSLNTAVILTAIAGFITILSLLSTLFLKNSGLEIADFLMGLIFSAGFGLVLAFTWQLHAKTQR